MNTTDYAAMKILNIKKKSANYASSANKHVFVLRTPVLLGLLVLRVLQKKTIPRLRALAALLLLLHVVTTG